MKSLSRNRQELVLPLRALHEPFALEAAGPDGDPGLNLLVARARARPSRDRGTFDAGLLVILERHFPRDRRQQHRGDRDDGDEPHPQTGKVGDPETDRDERDRRSQIRLLAR